RSVGNKRDRDRLKKDSSLMASPKLSCLLLSTGEDLPRGHSVMGRTLIIEMKKGAIEKGKLSECQADANMGLYAAAMAGYIRWLAPRYEAIRSEMEKRVKEWIDILDLNAHSRTPAITANLLVGMSYFLEYAEDMGAISEAECNRIMAQSRDAIIKVA